MTETEWLNSIDPIAMIEYLRETLASEDTAARQDYREQFDEASRTGHERKFRLFACACCRRIWDRIPEDCNRDAVVAVEDYLAGRLSGSELWTALVASSAVEGKSDGSGKRSEQGYWAVKYLGRGFYKMSAAESSLIVASKVLFLTDEQYGWESGVGHASFGRFRWPLPIPAKVDAERATQAALLRCVFGNPIHPIDFNAAWRSPNVIDIARRVYDDRAFDHMPILADALQDAGCEIDEILNHCRGSGPHIKGCWVVDACLEKS